MFKNVWKPEKKNPDGDLKYGVSCQCFATVTAFIN